MCARHLSSRGTHSRLLSFTVLRSLVVCTIILPTLTWTATPQYSGQMPSDMPSSSPLGSGGGFGGQYQDAFPIGSIAVPNGPSFELSLSYSSAVGSVVREQNRDVQASCVGLGFGLPECYIASDHRNTVDLRDDRYYYIGPEGVLQLAHDNWTYTTQNFRVVGDIRWRVERDVYSSGDIKRIQGWTIYKDDSMVYTFGDQVAYDQGPLPTRSSTDYTLSWGSSVAVGQTAGDALYPFRWRLAKIQTMGVSSSVRSEYEQDTAQLATLNPGNGNVSDHYYTAYSYLTHAHAESGNALELVYGNRADLQSFLMPTEYRTYATKRLDSVYVISPLETILSRVAFSYDHLGNVLEPASCKLLLMGITRANAVGDSSLPGTIFEYYNTPTDANYGALKSALSPAGGLAALDYQLLSTDSILTQLNYADTGYSPSIGYRRNWGSQAWSRNIFIGKYQDARGAMYRTFQVGSWNGYWHFQDFPDLVDNSSGKDWPGMSFEVAASDGWGVLRKRADNLFIVLENAGGVWVRDTIIPSWACNDWTAIVAGDRFFIASEVYPPDYTSWRPDSLMFRRAYYYCRSDTGWIERLIVDRSGENLLYGGVGLGLDCFGLALYTRSTTQTRGAFYYGKFNFATGGLEVGYDSELGNWYPDPRWAVGDDFVVCASHENSGAGGHYRVHRYVPSVGWQHTSWSIPDDPVGTLGVESISPMSNGFVISSHKTTVGPFGTPQLRVYHHYKNAQGWERQRYDYEGDECRVYSSGANTVALKVLQTSTCFGSNRYRVSVGRWNGSNIGFQLLAERIFGSGNKDASLKVSEEMIAWHERNSGTVFGARYLGSGQWSQSEQLVSGIQAPYLQLARDSSTEESKCAMLDLSRDVLVAAGVNAADLDDPKRILMYHALGNWHELDIEPLTANGFFDPYVPYNYMVGNFFDSYAPVVFRDRVALISGCVSRAAFQLYKGSWTAKPSIPVVTRITRSAYQGAPDAIATDVSYSGGLFDPPSGSARFRRCRVSAPHFLSATPQAYTISYFYNDVDTTFPVGPAYNGPKFPDLVDLYRYGISGGGFLLDGQVEYSFDSSATDPSGTCFDTTRVDFEISQLSVQGYRTFRTRTPHVHNRANWVAFESYTGYDAHGRPVSQRSRLYDDLVKVDSTKYDYDDDLTFFNRPSQQISLVIDNEPSVPDTQFVSRRGMEYRADGRLARSWQWGDASRWYLTGSIDSIYNQLVYQTFDSTSVHTYEEEVQEDGWCAFRSELVSSVLGEYCVIKLNGLVVDSLSSIWCKQGWQLLTSEGSFNVSAGDVIVIVHNNTRHYPAGSGNYCMTVGDYHKTMGIDGTEVIQFDTLAGQPNQGYDVFGNLVVWTGAGGDTAAVKFSADGRFQLATLANAHPNECLFFNGEYDFDALGYGQDNWYNSSPQYGAIVHGSGFSGSGAFGFLPVPGNQMLTRAMSRDSLLSDTYWLDFWARQRNATGGIARVRLRSYTPSTNEVFDSVLISPGDQNWGHIRHRFDTAPLGNIDSIRIEFVAVDLVADSLLLDDIRVFPSDASVSTTVYDQETGLVLAASGQENLPAKHRYDTFLRPVAIYDFKDRPVARTRYYLSRQGNNGVYVPSDPNYTRTVAYSDNDSTVSVSYTDGSGATLQTRTTAAYRGAAMTAVSGVNERNALGQPFKSYRSYIDLVGAAGVLDYSTTPEAEAAYFFNGTNNVDCFSTPYAGSRYASDKTARLIEFASPGADSLGSPYTRVYGLTPFAVVSGDTVSISSTSDEDGVESHQVAHARGKFAKTVSRYYRPDLSEDSVVAMQTQNLIGQESVEAIGYSSGPSHTWVEAPLTRVYTNDLGQVDSSWQVDRGVVRMLYDVHGRARFSQTDKQAALDRFAYCKYDRLGRSVEAGELTGAATFFTQSHAENETFPSSASNPEVAYRWYYDWYVSGSDTIVSPGALVRVESGDRTYYQEYYRYPTEQYDLTVTRLPISGGTLKAVRHDYDRDGALKRLTIMPHYPDTNGLLIYEYGYGQSGELASVSRGVTGPSIDHLDYARYTYDVHGAPEKIVLGVYDSPEAIPEVHDTLQKLDFRYDPKGALLGMNVGENLVPSVVPYMSGGVEDGYDQDHFAYSLVYNEGSVFYHNGRIRRIRSLNSTDVGQRDHHYTLTYNELGYLSRADHVTDQAFNRDYYYGGLGNRDSVKNGDGSIVRYTYDAQPGSSKLVATSGAVTHSLRYDAVGNLVADTAGQIYEMRYDFGNRLIFAKVAPNLAGGTQNTLEFAYDDAGQRIRKTYHFQYLEECGGGGIEDLIGGGGGVAEDGASVTGSDSVGFVVESGGATTDGSGGGEWCLRNGTSHTYYLYDGGTLLGTFDELDRELDIYVVGPNGTIATYRFNDNTQLHYHLTDHLGSSRAFMRGVPGTTPFVREYINYHPFGEIAEQQGSFLSDVQYTGKLHDKHSTFDYDYFGARYYDPQLGRFTSLDAAQQTASGYMFVGNDPFRNVDPDGNFFWQIIPFASMAYQWYQWSRCTGPVPTGTDIPGGTRDMLVGMASVAASSVGGITGAGIPNPYKGCNLAYGMAGAAASSAANTALWNVAGGHPWNQGIGISAAAGAAMYPAWVNKCDARQSAGSSGTEFSLLGDFLPTWGTDNTEQVPVQGLHFENPIEVKSITVIGKIRAWFSSTVEGFANGVASFWAASFGADPSGSTPVLTQAFMGYSNQNCYDAGYWGGYSWSAGLSMQAEAQIGLFQAPGAGGMARVGSSLSSDAAGCGYIGFDKEGVIRYIGQTGRPAAERFAEHALAVGTGREFLRYQPAFWSASSRARLVWEQAMIDRWGLAKNGGQLLNKINAIAPKRRLW